MMVFLSHAAHDAPIAHFLKDALGPQLGVDFFLLPDDVPPGAAWIERIRLGVERSDELYSIVSPEFLSRPWMSAEWACFWMRDKPTTPLLIETRIDELWEPMRAFQSVNLADATSVAAFLRSVSVKTRIEPTEGIRTLTNEIVHEIPRIRARQSLADAEQATALIRVNLRGGTDNINSRDVQTLVASNRMEELLSIATSAEAASVKQRQVAAALIDLSRFDEAAQIAEVIQNRSETRTICILIAERIPRGATEASSEWEVLNRLYSRLGRPQRRDVLEAMDRRGIVPLGRWATNE